MYLVYKSNAMPIIIGNYVKSSFIYDKWVVSDEYVEDDMKHEYRIVITSLDDV